MLDPNELLSPPQQYAADELETSPYSKKVQSTEIRRRLQQTLEMQRSEYTSPNLTDKQSALQDLLKQPQTTRKSSCTPGRRVLAQTIHDEFELSGSYSNKLLEEAINSGKKNLLTTALRNDSPDKYNHRRKTSSMKRSISCRKTLCQTTEPNLPVSIPCKSKGIIQNVFDGDLSIHSPSKAKRQSIIEDDTADLKQSSFDANQDKSVFTLEGAFQAAASQEKIEQAGSNPEDYILKFTSSITSMRKDIQLGSLVGIHLILKVFPNEIPASIIDHILEQLFTQLIHYEKHDVFW